MDNSICLKRVKGLEFTFADVGEDTAEKLLVKFGKTYTLCIMVLVLLAI